jgi:integrase
MASNLKLRNLTWFARVAVPRKLRATVGKAEVLRSLKTRDRREADRLKHRALADIHAELSRAAVAASLSPESAEYVVEVARLQREAVKSGTQSEESAELALDAALEKHLDRLAKKRGVGADGHPILPEAHERTLKLAHRVFRGEELVLLDDTVTKYLAEVKPRITNAGYSAKARQLAAFVEWIGKDTELSTITRKVTGRYASEVVQTSTLATKTRKDWLANLTAFGSWCEQYGLIEANPWRNLTRTIKESTRGGRPRPRPFTESELDHLVRSLPKGSPMLPLACLAAYSGARLEELCAMKVEHVTDDALRVMEGKNENSVRFIPLHSSIRPMVKRLLATSQDGYLITGLLPGGADDKRSHYVSKTFGDHLRRHKFPAVLTFHGLRRSFAQRCELVGVTETTAAQLLGHHRQGLSYGLYSPGVEFPQLTEAMAKITYGKPVDKLVADLGPTSEITKVSRRRTVGRLVARLKGTSSASA